MSDFSPLLERNLAFAATDAHAGVGGPPHYQVMVVTCMDHRVDPAHVLGIELGDAMVLRNAGGRVNDEVINEIVFIATLTETLFGDNAPPFEVAVVHHTQCGTGYLADPTFRASYASRIGGDQQALAAQAVVDPEATVRDDIERILSSTAVPSRVSVSGHIYDLDTGLVTTVEPAHSPS